MDNLRKRFGRLLAAHRRRHSLTQEALAEAAGVSVDTIAKIETGVTGARFPVIERLAAALEIDPAELFTTEIASGAINRGTFSKLATRLAHLSESELIWINELLDAALKRPTAKNAGSAFVPPSTSGSTSKKKATTFR